LPRLDGDAARQVMSLLHVNGQVARDGQAIVAADGRVVAAARLPNPRLDGAEIEARHNLHGDGHRPFHPVKDAQNLAVRIVFAPFAHGETIDEPGLARTGLERRLQNKAVADVPP